MADETEEFEFRARAEREAVAAAPQADAPQQSFAQANGLTGRGLASAYVRPIANAVSALPLLAMDLGVRGRNLLESPDSQYELPSHMYQTAMDRYTDAPTSAIGKGAEFLSSMVAGGALPAAEATSKLAGEGYRNLAPQNFMRAPQAARANALAVGDAHGLVAPPSQTNPTFMNRLLEGIGGKIKLNQEATMQNDPKFAQIAAGELGQNPDAPLSQGALQSIRGEASATGYAPLRNLGTITPTQKYTDALDQIASSSKNAASSFPGIKAEDVTGIIDPLKVPSFDSGDAIDAISNYRALADQAYRQGNNITGKAYKASAKALEDAIEQHLVDQGGNGSEQLAAFRDARVQMAKTYDVGKALNESTGQINAADLARIDKAKPGRLSGGLKDIATFAQAFPKASVMPKEDYPAISPLDMYGSTIAAGATGSAAPLLGPLTRVGIRQYLLSEAGQARAMPSVPATSSGGFGYNLGPLISEYLAK